MPLDTSSKRRSSVSLLSPWQVAPPSPTDTPGVLDQADREQIAWSYSGILASPALPIPPIILGVLAGLQTSHGTAARLRLSHGLLPSLVATGRGTLSQLRG